ncbi:MAG: phosphatidylinositol mannoside acyltransferase [Micromonosporaceae bacterium]|nr:phosphatidylinositol mannoside acyltransferase [Micromonosporaceae bacterium]
MVDLGYAAGWRLVRTLPRPVAAAGFNVVADRVARRGGTAARRLAGNLRRVVGPDLPEADLAELVRAGMRSTLRYYLEAFRLPARSPRQVLTDFELENRHLIDADLEAGRGCVVALPHAGNWDAAGAWAVASGWSLVTVQERLRPESLFRRFVAYREKLGMEILPAKGGTRPPLEVLTERLRQGCMVALLADRDLSTRGVEVTFFGGRTRMPAGPALLALQTGAPLYAMAMWYGPRRAHGALLGPVELPARGSLDERVRYTTQLIADALASGIAAHPADWHMLQPLWLSDLPAPAPLTR